MHLRLTIFTLLSVFTGLSAQSTAETLDRGVVALRTGAKEAFVSWRLLAGDPEDAAFHLYRTVGDGESQRVSPAPLTGGTNFLDEHADFSAPVTYRVEPADGSEGPAGASFTLVAESPVQNYLSVPLQTPEGFTPNDASVGDLDGDGQYEMVVHQVGRGHDNSHSGMTTPPVLEAYELDGTLLWRIDLGRNIREGAHYTQFIVYDLDGDGRAEVACKTADGTTDGAGTVIGDPDANYVNEKGYILAGPEYLTVFDGQTGAALTTVDYDPPRHPDTERPTTEQLDELWGDGYGNRMDRFLAGVAYLDGEHPSLIMARGYYTRTVVAAYDFGGGALVKKWTFDSSDGNPENAPYAGQGNHSLSVADVDDDGKQEIIYGAMVLDDDGTGLHTTGFGHGDALHVSDLDPTRPGLEIFDIQERFDDAGAHFRDARTGEILWKKPSVKAGEDGEGPGRGLSANIDPRYPGNEQWVRGANIEGLFSAKGELISEHKPPSCNFAVWWDGDLLRELLTGNTITKWDWESETVDTLLLAEGATSNNGTKATPALSADLFGDWREEVILRSENNQELRIYTTTIPTEHRLVTLMQNPVYRVAIAWQNVAYNQPPHPDFFIGEEMDRRSRR
ncbi:rhamnogalacturonan lyase [Lewinella sp. IMCC34191]|uniref:rhamnogalacturonan lyase n=1 Tax=Lewinella sp. IMCC34191 TaxID=2259172 RepID=UPI000E23365B|nr:rhamnogalacturonan lyase [Lewinella sp. IMCC34191]